MLSIIWLILGTMLTLITVAGTLELIFLTFGGLFATNKKMGIPLDNALKLAVVVPAHNESEGIVDCIHSLQACQPPKGHSEIYVIADNCTDNTAELARAAGAQVIERHNEQERGKGYALDYAFQKLLSQGVDAVVVIDADTSVEANFLISCEHAFSSGAAAIQCRYTVKNVEDSLRTRLMHLALLAFNILRPRGREFWGVSAGISGNGFGLHRTTLEKVPYSARSVVEDLEYHLQLVNAGLRVQFIDQTCVRAAMPTAKAGTETQRTRWEGGRFRMMVDFIPILVKRVLTGDWRALEPLLELLLLPLALHVVLLVITLLIPTGWTQVYALFALFIVTLHVLAAWWVGSRRWHELSVLFIVPFYILWKLILLPQSLRNARKNTAWQRTERE